MQDSNTLILEAIEALEAWIRGNALGVPDVTNMPRQALIMMKALEVACVDLAEGSMYWSSEEDGL